MLGEQEKKKAKALFSEYLDLLEARKATNDQIRDIKDEFSVITSTKKTVVTKLFSFLQSKYEKGIDELDDVITIAEELE